MSNIFRNSKKNDGQHPTRYYSSKQEKSVAKALSSGKCTANSGATMWQKGDVTAKSAAGKQWLIECKTCTKQKEQFTVKKEWFTKNLQEQVFMGKDYSAVVFNFGPDEPCYYIIDEITFKELTDL